MSENNPSTHALGHVLTVINALTPLLIRSGIGYNEFAAACKPIFYRQAIIEAERNGQKKTDSSVSLLSGLHRRDTATLRKALLEDPSLSNSPLSQPVSLAKQVVALWINKELKDTINITGNSDSFADLVEQVSKDQHFRSILTDLERIGVVSANKEQVTLLRTAFTPNLQEEEAREILAENVADHITTCIKNIFSEIENRETDLLETAISTNGLSKSSIQELQTLSNKLWFDAANQIEEKVAALKEKDNKYITSEIEEIKRYRFKIGMYSANEKEKTSPTDINLEK